MALRTIINGSTIPVNQVTGTTPDIAGAVKDWFQLMVFNVVSKSTVNFQAVEVSNTINFWGFIFPYSDNQLRMLPEGQRTQWQYFKMYAEPATILKPDDVINYLGVQYRVLDRRDWSLNRIMEYSLITDWSGAGPT